MVLTQLMAGRPVIIWTCDDLSSCPIRQHDNKGLESCRNLTTGLWQFPHKTINVCWRQVEISSCRFPCLKTSSSHYSCKNLKNTEE